MQIFHSIGILGIIFALAFLTESLTEYISGTPLKKLGAAQWKWLLMYISMAVGVDLAFWYQLDLVALLASIIGENIALSWVGFVLTGLGIGRGANWLHQFVEKFFPGKQAWLSPRPISPKSNAGSTPVQTVMLNALSWLC